MWAAALVLPGKAKKSGIEPAQEAAYISAPTMPCILSAGVHHAQVVVEVKDCGGSGGCGAFAGHQVRDSARWLPGLGRRLPALPSCRGVDGVPGFRAVVRNRDRAMASTRKPGLPMELGVGLAALRCALGQLREALSSGSFSYRTTCSDTRWTYGLLHPHAKPTSLVPCPAVAGTSGRRRLTLRRSCECRRSGQCGSGDELPWWHRRRCC
jgi:hypothetical protein